MKRTIITTLLAIISITNIQAGKSKGKITLSGKPGHVYSMGITNSLLPSNTKDKTFLTNSLGITANVFFPIIKSPSANFGFNVCGTYDFGGKGNPSATLPNAYNITGQTSSNVVYRGVDPRNPGFKTAIGPQANFLVGNRFVISPMVPVGYMSLTQKTLSAVQTTSYNGQTYEFNLATLPENKISGIIVNPTLRLQYFVSKSVGFWIEGSYLTGPKVETQLTKLIPNGAANQQGSYDIQALENATFVKGETKTTNYRTAGIGAGVVYTFRVKHQGKHDSGLDDIGDVAVRDGRASGRGIIFTPNNQTGENNNTRQKNDTSKSNKKEKKVITTYTDNLQKEEITKTNNCCKGSSWGKIVEVVSETKPTKSLPDCGSSLGTLECGSTKQYKACYNSNNICKIPTIIKYEIFDNSNNLLSSSMASSCSIANVVLPITTGAYQLKISALVDNKVCNTCNYSFETNCS